MMLLRVKSIISNYRCPTRSRTGKTSPSLRFLRIAACMCLYVLVCACMCVCMRFCLCVCMCAYVRVSVFVCVFVCVSTAAVYVLVCVPDVFLLCLLRCPPVLRGERPAIPYHFGV